MNEKDLNSIWKKEEEAAHIHGWDFSHIDSFLFVIYMIHVCSNHWKHSPAEVYKKMKCADCIMGFLVPNYEILHTQSTQYIMEDIKEYLNTRGISV